MIRDDLSIRLPLASRDDEIGLLAKRFNLMAEHLQARDRQIREKSVELEEANRSLHDLNATLEQKVDERTRDLQESLEQVRRTSAALEDSKRRLEAANQDLVRANQAKANFLSIISHELKTPLSVINGFLSLILDERYENDAQHLREAVQISKRRGEQLSRMIDELIDLSRLDARSMVLRRVPTDVAAILRELGNDFQEEFRRRALRFSLRLPPELPPLLCDPDKLRQVFSNLIGNALKFSPDGGEIELGAEDRGDEVILTCRDTGIGIPEAERERIFEKFYQVDSSATRRFGGAGLGLSIVREIVLLHGGRIWVESTPGHGSTFFIALPKNPPRDAGRTTAPLRPLGGRRLPPDSGRRAPRGAGPRGRRRPPSPGRSARDPRATPTLTPARPPNAASRRDWRAAPRPGIPVSGPASRRFDRSDAVVGDRETVGLVAHALQQQQHRRSRGQGQRRAGAGGEDRVRSPPLVRLGDGQQQPRPPGRAASAAAAAESCPRPPSSSTTSGPVHDPDPTRAASRPTASASIAKSSGPPPRRILKRR